MKVWFSPDVSGYIKEKIWHESQEINPQNDGSIIFEAEMIFKLYNTGNGKKKGILNIKPE